MICRYYEADALTVYIEIGKFDDLEQRQMAGKVRAEVKITAILEKYQPG